MTTKYKNEFSLTEDINYLNHAAVSPWPVRSKNAVEQFARENCLSGSTHYPDWVKKETGLRKKLAILINASDYNDIALVKNTSEGLSMVAFGYPWHAGDNVVIPAHEFPSNRIVWEALKSKGVEVRQIDIYPETNPEEKLLEATDKHTRIISVSSVHYAHGLRLDLSRIGDYCKNHDIMFCVDAIQSIGAVEMDVAMANADFVIADGHKWMLGPEGLALFYSRPEARDKLHLNEFGWHMLEKPHDFDQTDWQIAHSARRFECGSPNMLCTFALYESINLILEVGVSQIESRVLDNSKLMHDYLRTSKNLTCVSAEEKHRFAGIVSFKHSSIPSQTLYDNLMAKNIMCANRADAIRFSPHFYTEQKAIEEALKLANAGGK